MIARVNKKATMVEVIVAYGIRVRFGAANGIR